MILPPAPFKAFILPFLAFAFLALRPLNAQVDGPLGGAVVVANTINMDKNAIVDSFDSGDPSGVYYYDPSRRQMDGNIFINSNTNSDLHNAFVYGAVAYSGSVVKNTGNVQGPVSTPSTVTVQAVADPSWPNGSFVQYTGGGNPPVAAFVASGTITNPTLIKVVGDLTVSGGKTLSILTDAQVDRYLTVWVTGKFTTSGTGRLDQYPLAHVTWIVDKDITTSGDTYQNTSGYASNLSFRGVGAGKVNITTGSISFLGTINAPSRSVNISGPSGLVGGLYSSTLALGSGSAVHCDTGLAASGRNFTIACETMAWGPGTNMGLDQYVESGIQFTGQPDLGHYTSSSFMFGYANNGTAMLMSNAKMAFLDLSGRLLQLKAVDLAGYVDAYPAVFQITFVGSKVDGSTVSQTFVTDGQLYGPYVLPVFKTFAFGDQWTNLVRVDLQGDYPFVMDNIVLQR